MNPASIKLIRHLNLAPYGCEIMASADINGDGRTEFVFYQSAGMLCAATYRPGSKTHYDGHTTPDDQALDCMTAIDAAGRILWQTGAPWNKAIPFRTHGGHDMLLAADINGDGACELLRIRGDQLMLLDGRTGRPLRSAILDNDGYSQMLTARFTGESRCQVVVHPIADGLDGHPHGCPVAAFDEQLRPFWGRHDFTRAGHVPKALDVDGDGCDELLIGLDCVNPDGSVRWTLPVEGGAPCRETYCLGHDDRRTFADINGDGRLEQVLALEQLGLVVSDLEGHVLWRHPAPNHCGEACVGKFIADVPGLQIFINNERFRLAPDPAIYGSAMLDCFGRVLWTSQLDRYALPVAWPTAVGPQALLAQPHGEDIADRRPFVMDGNGELVAVFDVPPHLPTGSDYKIPHTGVWYGDWGDYYCARVIKSDRGTDRIALWNRRDLWLFEHAGCSSPFSESF